MHHVLVSVVKIIFPICNIDGNNFVMVLQMGIPQINVLDQEVLFFHILDYWFAYNVM